ncbi:MAG: hypothetical protein M1819_002921 [Sarea resinae]|nr:MAG: hypothetical protein M1819_002921 [Sarea resinae]
MPSNRTSFTQSTDSQDHMGDPRRCSFAFRDATNKSISVPPPVNRADKPKVPIKPPSIAMKAPPDALLSSKVPNSSDERVSPFSTPPSSEDGHDDETPPRPNILTRGKIKASPGVPESHFEPPPVHHSVADMRRMQASHATARSPSLPAARQRPHVMTRSVTSHAPEARPGLPPRRDVSAMEARAAKPLLPPPAELPPRHSLDASRPSPALIAASTSNLMAPPKRNFTSGIHLGSSLGQAPRTLGAERSFSAASNVSRSSLSLQRPEGSSYADDSDEVGSGLDGAAPALTDYPDSSQANRRRPCFNYGPQEIPTKYETKLFDICGEYVCTTGFLTRVWNVLTGEPVMSISHGETVKVTALAFKPAASLEDEGKRLWLGTNAGEIQEIDIPSQSTVASKGSAHTRKEVMKIYRHANEMWSLDDEGSLYVWPPDETGIPDLKYTPSTFRVPRGHTFSLVVGSLLWLATGKDIRVFQPSYKSSTAFQVLQRPLSQPNVGEVTSGAIISSQPDRVYFGHVDGKVTVYSRADYSCLEIVNVSLYKINSLTGVGDYLWAAYKTGMIYVYDTRSQPWVVKKDWHAHDNPVASVLVDRSSILTIDRLQVASLGTDNAIRIWDGMLRDDWLESEMQQHDVDFCDFREVKATVVTWNAGAAKPGSLKSEQRDAQFFRDVFQPEDPPDILVFGFQELVDLENKKLTAKSLFKGKKKDPADQEHMSRQYRAWRDYLARCIEDFMPLHETYHLLHTASMVGLFTCVFVKASERDKVRNVCAAEVKRGMGGLHGNKGALIMRFILDDSSLCFVNCHLAAGQTQTIHRNNDLAAILETAALPAERDPASRTDMFVGGGDGTMILDHEMCILNGDLNYRIDTMGRDTVIDAVKQKKLTKLLERDQLLLSRKKNPGFRLRGFIESPITFAPTYKYDVGTDNYDSSEKKRAPAWCDRLLYRGIGRLKQVDYRRHEVRVSDHRPVSGSFKMRIKTISPKRRVVAWQRCEQRFEEVKQRLADEAKLDFLINVYGYGPGDARRVLAEMGELSSKTDRHDI